MSEDPAEFPDSHGHDTGRNPDDPDRPDAPGANPDRRRGPDTDGNRGVATDGGTERRLVEGWQGRFYEDFAVGDVYKHPYGRTVTETDNVWFTNLTMNVNPMHFNEAYAAGTEFGERLVDGTYVFALAVGMSVVDVSGNATANLGYDDVRHHAPVFHGDTIFAESEVLDKRESESREHVGIVTTELRAFNADDDLVLSLERTPMVLKREYAEPSAARPTGWPEGVGTQPADLDPD